MSISHTFDDFRQIVLVYSLPRGHAGEQVAHPLHSLPGSYRSADLLVDHDLAGPLSDALLVGGIRRSSTNWNRSPAVRSSLPMNLPITVVLT